MPAQGAAAIILGDARTIVEAAVADTGAGRTSRTVPQWVDLPGSRNPAG
jgi:hypothetical protein